MRLVAALAASLACLAGASGASAAGARPQTFTFALVSIAGIDKPVYVAAHGAIDGFGTETQTSKERKGVDIVDVTLHFADGTLRFTALDHNGFRLHMNTCTATTHGSGPWTVTGGTGAYAGATGGGHFTEPGTVFAQRSSNGTCRADRTPPNQTVSYLTAKLRGVLTLPSS
jgi:hypothetical protein